MSFLQVVKNKNASRLFSVTCIVCVVVKIFCNCEVSFFSITTSIVDTPLCVHPCDLWEFYSRAIL